MRNSFDPPPVGGIGRQHVSEGVCDAMLQISRAHYLEVAEARMDGAFAHRRVHPLDESGRQNEGRRAEGHRERPIRLRRPWRTALRKDTNPSIRVALRKPTVIKRPLFGTAATFAQHYRTYAQA